MKLFLSYKFDDQEFVELVHYVLSKQPAVELYYWPVQGRPGVIDRVLTDALNTCDLMIAFLGAELGETQAEEIDFFRNRHPKEHYIPVQLVEKLPDHVEFGVGRLVKVRTNRGKLDLEEAREVAHRLFDLLQLQWIPEDGLPSRYIVNNEKKFLEKFRCGDEELLRDLRKECGWTVWPEVTKERADLDNPIPEDIIGKLADDTPVVLLDARPNCCGPGEEQVLTFPEARPRLRLRYPLKRGGTLRVAILVSGGIAPGINAVIDGIVSRHFLYSRRQKAAGVQHNLDILGYREGFKALFRGRDESGQTLTENAVLGVVEAGGAFLGTSRADNLLDGDAKKREEALKAAVEHLRTDKVQILYVIGGDGSMRCAHALRHYAQQLNYDLSVVGIPKAMDNDILWVWQSFGFLSAVEEARHAIVHMHTEVSSNPRVGIIQLFGSDSGFIASHAGYSTACDLVLIPEDPLSMDDIVNHIGKKLLDRFNKDGNAGNGHGNGLESSSPYAIVVMAETALPEDALEYCDHPCAGLSKQERDSVELFFKNKRRVRGQTPDELRRAALKIVSGVLEDKIRTLLEPTEYWKDFRVITNEPRHLIRSIPPSVADVIFGERLGALAVDNAMAGYTDFMVSQWLTEFVLVPLPLVVLGRKRVSTDGIFWKSVVSKTQQPGLTRAKHES